MNLIIIFWLNSDNFTAVIPNKPEKGTVEKQVEKWEEERKYPIGQHIGIEYFMDEF